MKIGSIVVRCYEFDRMLAFWQEALGYEPREPARGGWVVLRDPEGRGPNVSLDRVPKPGSPTPSARTLEPLGKTSRVHLDLYTTDQEGEVERLIGIGATRYVRNTARMPTSSCWKIPMATASASFRYPTRVRQLPRVFTQRSCVTKYECEWRHPFPGSGVDGIASLIAVVGSTTVSSSPEPRDR